MKNIKMNFDKLNETYGLYDLLEGNNAEEYKKLIGEQIIANGLENETDPLKVTAVFMNIQEDEYSDEEWKVVLEKVEKLDTFGLKPGDRVQAIKICGLEEYYHRALIRNQYATVCEVRVPNSYDEGEVWVDVEWDNDILNEDMLYPPYYFTKLDK